MNQPVCWLTGIEQIRFPAGNQGKEKMVPHRKSRVAPPPPDCPLTACLKIIAGTWTGNVIWYLREGPRRFLELKADLRGVSAKTLTARLRRLASDGIVYRRNMPTSPPTVEYGLTELGMKLVPAVEAIAAVGRELKHAQSRNARDARVPADISLSIAPEL
jgi:DNA-binding HxlR family transcriptional regulator